MSAVRRARGQVEIVAADALLQPVALLAIALLIANDHWLKQAWPGLLTGKLSDFSGLIFFPLLLQAAWEVATAAVGRLSLASQRVLGLAIVATGVVFASIKIVPIAGAAYRDGLGLLQWVGGVLLGAATAQPMPVQLAADPADLIALVALVVPWLIGRQRAQQVAA